MIKHVLFDCNPSIPVAFYIHDRKSEEIHLDFWRKIATLVPNINRASTVLVTDREKAVVNAIKKFQMQPWSIAGTTSTVMLNIGLTTRWYKRRSTGIYQQLEGIATDAK